MLLWQGPEVVGVCGYARRRTVARNVSDEERVARHEARALRWCCDIVKLRRRFAHQVLCSWLLMESSNNELTLEIMDKVDKEKSRLPSHCTTAELRRWLEREHTFGDATKVSQ